MKEDWRLFQFGRSKLKLEGELDRAGATDLVEGSARLRDIATLEAFLYDLLLLFGGSIYAWFPAHVASYWEALILPR